VYAYLRRRGYGREDASDITQDFLADVMISRDLVGKADRARGRFRSFLLRSLENHLVDRHRKSVTVRRGGETITLPQDPELLELVEPDPADDPGTAFERQWSASLLSAAIELVERDCRGDGAALQWRAFEARVLRPIRNGGKPASVEAVMDEVGARSRQELYSMLQTVKRRLQRTLRQLVAETLDEFATESDIDDEVGNLYRSLGPGWDAAATP
jgi:hypothetical protein